MASNKPDQLDLEHQSYHNGANKDINVSGLWAGFYNTLLFGVRATSRATLAADCAMYKTTSVAIRALDNLDIS